MAVNTTDGLPSCPFVQDLTIGATAGVAALHRMIEMFPDHPTITVVDGTRRAVGRVDVAAVQARTHDGALVVRDVMTALPT